MPVRMKKWRELTPWRRVFVLIYAAIVLVFLGALIFGYPAPWPLAMLLVVLAGVTILLIVREQNRHS